MSNQFKKSKLAKAIAGFAGLTTGLMMVGGSAFTASAASDVAALQAQIASLLATINSLSAQIATLTGGSSVPPTTGGTGYVFNNNLTIGSTGEDVRQLQILLNSDPATQVAASGVGSKGNETTYYGPLTGAAVIKFQEKYASEILAPVGLTSGVVHFGPSTRAKANMLNAASAPSVPTPPTGGVVVPGVLGAALSPLTPAAASIATVAEGDFTKFSLSAGASDVTVTNMWVKRTGLSSNSNVQNIKIVDENGVRIGSIGSLNTNGKAQIVFTPALVIPANTTKELTIRAGVASNAASGAQIILGIESASDIIGSATFPGTFPIYGNAKTVVSVTIGTLSVTNDGTVIDSQPDGGDTGVVVNKFRLTAGSVEGVTISQISVEESGTASLSDTANIELYDVTNNVSLGTVSGWDANGLATWSNLNLMLDKGDNIRLEVRLDVLSGSSLTVNTDLTDGSDVMVIAKGNDFNFDITPSVTGGWNGKGAADQTIQAGSLTVLKSGSTPATGNISQGDDILLAVYDMVVEGESMKIESFEVNMDTTGLTDTEITSIKLVDENGALLAGPSDGEAGGDNSETVVFTDLLILPVGTTKIYVTADIADAASNGDTVQVDIDNPSTELDVTGLSSNDDITPTPATTVSGNVLTVQGGTLTATTLTQPAARSVVDGVQDFIWATFAISANDSGENVNVTSLTIENTLGDAADDAGTIDNVEIWADLDGNGSFEAKVSDTKQFTDTGATDETLSFNLDPVVTILQDTTINFAVIGDLASGATAGDTHTISLDTDAGDVTANGASTGNTISVTPSGTGQTMTVSAGGVLTVSVDSSSPDASLLLDDTAAEQTVAVFRFAASEAEDLDVDSIRITDDGSDSAVNMYKFYNGTTLLGSATPIGGVAQLFLSDGALVVPSDGNVKVTVKAVMYDIANSGFVNGNTLAVTIAAAGDVETTGLSSGDPINSTDTNVDAAIHTLYEAFPVFALDPTSPSGNLIAGGDTVLAKFVITNNGDEDITFLTGNGDEIIVTVTSSGMDAPSTLDLVDENGNILSNNVVWANAAETTVTFNFASYAPGLTVAAGQSEVITIKGDTATAGLTANGELVQVWLDDSADANLEFSIDGVNSTFEEGVLVFKGDIFGNSLVDPS